MWVPPKYREDRDRRERTQPIPLELPLQPSFPTKEKTRNRQEREKGERGVFIIEI